MPIRILLADDHNVVRHGLKAALEREPGMEVIAEAEDGRSAVALCRKHQPDIVLMDIHMPELSGTEATRQIVCDSPATMVIGLSMYSHQRYIQGMFEAGAMGFLVKNCTFDELALAIHTVMDGKRYLASELAGSIIKAALDPSRQNGSDSSQKLSYRELEVLQLIAEGLTNKSIAVRLAISDRTVEGHRREIMRKLDLHSVAELTKFAVREGLTLIDS